MTKKQKAPKTSPSPSIIKKAISTQFPSPVVANKKLLDNQQKVDAIAAHFEEIMKIIGLDLSDDSLQETPQRIARMYINEIFSGLDESTFPKITFMENKVKRKNQSSMLIVKAGFTSFCEHHFVPMTGEAFIAFIPNKKLIGLSKIPRIIRFFARRPQLQERLTAQISDCLSILLETQDVAVAVKAKHYCVLARGVEDHLNNTTTLVLKGEFETNSHRRQEFFESMKNSVVDSGQIL